MAGYEVMTQRKNEKEFSRHALTRCDEGRGCRKVAVRVASKWPSRLIVERARAALNDITLEALTNRVHSEASNPMLQHLKSAAPRSSRSRELNKYNRF